MNTPRNAHSYAHINVILNKPILERGRKGETGKEMRIHDFQLFLQKNYGRILFIIWCVEESWVCGILLPTNIQICNPDVPKYESLKCIFFCLQNSSVGVRSK